MDESIAEGVIPEKRGIRNEHGIFVKWFGDAKENVRSKVSLDMCTYFVITETKLVDAVEFG